MKKKLKLYILERQKLIDMPINDVGILIENTWFSNLTCKIILTKYFSKFTGFVLNNRFLSFLLINLKIIKKINQKIHQTFLKEKYTNLNQAFIHRHDRILYPTNSKTKKVISSPADSYFNIREIKNNQVALFPELVLDIEKMVGKKYAKLFSNGGKFLLFTLKPFHDHTIDYPTDSKVLETPVELNQNNKKVFSTDLHYAKFASQNLSQKIFDENHRVVTKLLSTEFSEEYLLIEVGAVNVNSIEQDNCQKDKIYKRGEQKSHFNFGSTVIMLLPKTFSEKLYFPKIYSQEENVSVEIKRRNIIALDIKDKKLKIDIAKNIQNN